MIPLEGDIWTAIFSATTLFVILIKVAPILLASIGGAFTQQGDILNIGLEGNMLISAFTAIWIGASTNNAFIGVVAAVVSSILLSLLYALCTLVLKADFIVVGIGVNILAAGLTVFIMQIVYNSPGVTPPDQVITLPRIDLGPIGQIPVIGPAINNQTPLVWLAFLCVPLFSYVLYRTQFGVHLRAVGEDPGAAEAAGIPLRRTKFWSILIAGLLCGLAGAQLSMATLGSFTAGMTSGRGFIAVAALTFGRARPVPTLIAALIFGTADAVADQLGVAGFNSSLALMTPYIITIVALVFAGLDLRKRFKRRALAASVA
ncbi:MAG: ABC transporter permease [Actinobacteria bacterium]|nr:ABC transporter permease [Actinomycetota bacterium]